MNVIIKNKKAHEELENICFEFGIEIEFED